MAALDLTTLSTIGQLARRWGACEATTRNVAKRLFGELPRIGRAHVLRPDQAEQLRVELQRRGLVLKQA